MDCSNFLHWNRDENSFTARLFEGILFPLFKQSDEAFQDFLNTLVEKSADNLKFIQGKFPDTNIIGWKKIEIPFFKDGMLFLECVDVYSYIKNEFINQVKNEDLFQDLLPKEWDNKTEFDCVILCEDKKHNKHLIVFEVKCYTDLKEKEINRQHDWLEKFKEIGLIDEYHHFGLISYSNLHNATGIFIRENFKYGFSILSWEDLRLYLIESDRFHRPDVQLYKVLHKDGSHDTKRYLIKP
ncbi:hypothetical protein [Neobacillus drentensis]|uniref:hypothetical protein n=1 Tax=Neobacillus drentensis TaxID=220684 RepID=UPI00300004ED